MPSISTLTTTKPEDIEVEVANGDIVHLTVAPGSMTGTVMVEIASSDDEAKSYLLICDVLASTVLSWDITTPVTKDGVTTDVPLPITKENILLFPVDFIMAVFSKMQEAVNPPTTSGGSFGGS